MASVLHPHFIASMHEMTFSLMQSSLLSYGGAGVTWTIYYRVDIVTSNSGFVSS